MKTVQWNKEQKRAVDLRNSNILVSAGAGSGKTAVLTERIVQLIEEGNSILDFAVCTFTEDATLEMKNRIRERLMEKGLEEQADMVYMADISTIHSICKKIIADNFDGAGLPPKFSILTAEDVPEEQAMSEALNNLFEDEEFTAFAMKFSPNDDTRIKELIRDSYRFCCNIPDWKGFLYKQKIMYKSRDYSRIENNYCRLKVYGLRQRLQSYDMLLEKTALTNSELALVEKDKELLRGIIKSAEAGRLPKDKPEFERMPPKQPNKEEIDKVRKQTVNLVNAMFEYKAVLNCDEIMTEAGHDLEMLIKGIAEFERAYSEVKLSKGYLTFNDLERYAYEILQRDSVAEEYKKRYKYIFVDEYQDTSRLQQAILERLSGDRNVFLVGDIKQSIYAFRNADPSMFHKIYQEYGKEGKDIRIDLFRNYRSSKNILDFVNDVFSLLLNLNESYYPKEAYLLTDINSDETPVEIDLVADGEDKELCEARQIAARIEECIKAGYKYKDIAVLFRSVKYETALLLFRLLRDKGIPADMSSGSDELYMETRVFIDLISIIDNSDNDIPLISVMFSDLGGFTVDDLIEIKKGRRCSFYECCKSYGGDKALEQKLSDFFAMIDDFAMRSRSMAADELMSAVLMHTGYLKQVETQKDGKAKVSQLYNLLRSASEFETMGYYGISGFMEYFSALKELKKAPETEGFVMGSDAVSIMTMHKSKGLEFPAVIIGGLNKRLYRQGEDSYYVFNKDMGIGLTHIDTDKKAKIQTPLMGLIKEQNTIETLEEQMRMLYVAMTRAKEKMYLVSSISDEALGKIEDTGFFAGGLMSSRATFLQAVLMAVYARRSSAAAKYNINRINMNEEEAPLNARTIVPEYSERVSGLLKTENDTYAVTVPKKAAVTELTKDKEVFVPYKSRGIQKSNDGALAGTVTHNLLRHLKEGESFDALMDRMKRGEYFTDKELSLISREMVEGFMASSLYKRMRSAKKVYREKPFILELDESSGYTDEPVMVQGIIDCVFYEDGGFVLADYKTDNIIKNAESILKEKYARQLELYSFAISALTGEKVKEKIIFHLRTGREIHL